MYPKDGNIPKYCPCGDIFVPHEQNIAYKSYQVMFFFENSKMLKGGRFWGHAPTHSARKCCAF